MPVQVDAAVASGTGEGDVPTSTASVGSTGAALGSTTNVGRAVGETNCGVVGTVGPQAPRRSASVKTVSADQQFY